eukprot:67019-Amphidinium_carterae.2
MDVADAQNLTNQSTSGESDFTRTEVTERQTRPCLSHLGPFMPSELRTAIAKVFHGMINAERVHAAILGNYTSAEFSMRT